MPEPMTLSDRSETLTIVHQRTSNAPPNSQTASPPFGSIKEFISPKPIRRPKRIRLSP
jgi:hypothetical protein